MKRQAKTFPVDLYGAISLALCRYHFRTPDIRILISHVLGKKLSRHNIRRLVKSGGNRLARGRPSVATKVNRGDLFRLIELTSGGIELFSGNALHLLDHIKVQFGLSPRQYLDWVAKFVRRGGFLLRRCLLCGDHFPSLQSGERHCGKCRSNRRRLLKEYDRSIWRELSEFPVS